MIYEPPIAFAGAELDHLEDKREPEDLRAFLDDPAVRAVILNDGKPAIQEDGKIKTVHPNTLVGKNIALPGPIFLGTDAEGPVFAFSLMGGQSIAPNEAFQEMRFVASRMDAKSLAIAGRAKSLFDWHSSHRFCSNCGAESQAVKGCLLYTSPSPRDATLSRMPSSA